MTWSGPLPGRDPERGGAGPEERAPAAYRLLLLLMPPSWRREHGAAAERLVADMRAHERRRGAAAAIGFWGGLAWDTAGQAIGAWVEVVRASARTVDESRGGWGMGTLGYDLRHAGRSLARHPTYAVMVVFMMLLAVAANTAVFRVYSGLFLRPLPFPSSERLVDLDTRAPRWNLEYTSVAYADFAGWRAGNETFESMGVYGTGGASLSATDGAARVEIVRATHDLATTLGIEPVVGRLFTAAEDVPDGPSVALLAHGLWTTRYGADPSVVGASLTLDDRSFEIIGVLPPEASFVRDADVWIPLGEDPDLHESFTYHGFGRLRAGVTPEQAEADLTRVHKGLAERWSVNVETFPVVDRLRDRYVAEARSGLDVLLGAVAVVLLLACANIAGLALVRALGRQREVEIRLAMGAGRGSIVRHLFVESALLAVVGGTAGAAAGVWLSGLVVSRLEGLFPAWIRFDTDLRVVAFSVATTAATAILFGMWPALRLSRADPGGSFQASTGRGTATRARARATDLLVASQVALACVLLVTAGVTLRDAQALAAVDPGFRTGGVLAYTVQLPEERFPESADRVAFWREHVERVGRVPGVRSAGATTILPLSGHMGWFFEVEDAPPRGANDPNPVVLLRVVTPGYLGTMDIPILRGRAFTDRDGREPDTGVLAVNESFVREFLSHREDPLGARVGVWDDVWWTVVAVTPDTKHYGLDRPTGPAVWVPPDQVPPSSMSIAVRADGDPTRLTGALSAVLEEQAPGVAMFQVTTMAEILEETLWARRASLWLMLGFAGAALVLAVAGTYGVLSYRVRQRVQEIGIRMAMGARREQVARQVLRDGLRIVGAGTAVGLGVAFGVGPALGSALFQASPRDPWVYACVLLALPGVAALATLLPARRAAALDPMRVLRGD